MTSLSNLETLLDPTNKDFQNGMQERVWSLRPLSRPQDKYLIVIPAGSHMVAMTSDETAPSLNDKLNQEQIQAIEKRIFEVRKKGTIIETTKLIDWCINDGTEEILSGKLGENKVNIVLLEKILKIFNEDKICIYPPAATSEKPYIFEGLMFRAILAPIYKKSDVKTIPRAFPLILEDMSGGLKAFVESGREIKAGIRTPESVWEEYFGEIIK